ncbi:MAG: hypothetical protein CL608_25985 [Anaerolineaceae bacterium]|nr:hypothetical protein [Anaerolineaceae bacterium]
MRSYQRILALLLALTIVVFGRKMALAHERVEIGPYVIVVGWVNEPAIVGERNALFLEITENDEPVTGVEATLDAELLYGGRTFRSNLTPSLTPGQYTVEFIPTVRGQYDVRLFGSIEDTDLDEVVAPEEVFSADRIQFPEPEPSVRELQRETQQQIDELEARLQTAQLVAYIGVGVGLVGIALAIWSLRRKQKTSN